jgi:DNA-binding transcriptional regulator PaaX
MKKPLRERSALIYVLVALIPYSKPNLLLTYKPGLFFRELEKISRYKQSTLRKAYNRGIKSGLIERQSSIPRLTLLGKQKVMPYVATKLGKKASLMVIFDIPEIRADARRSLRILLRQWNFKQVQKSVWVSNYDFRDALAKAVEELDLAGCVEIHESIRIYPNPD